MAKKKASAPARQRKSATPAATNPGPTTLSPVTRNLAAPVFGQPSPTPDPTTFRVPHPSDGQAYKLIDQLVKEHKIFPLPFTPPRGLPEPVLTLAQVLGGIASAPPAVAKTAAATVAGIENSGQIVARRVQSRRTELNQITGRKYHIKRQDVRDGKAVFEAVSAA